MACELPKESGQPLSRYSRQDLLREVTRRGLVAKISERTILVHLPVHASWLNQVEIYFSVIQRKVLTPNDFASLVELSQRLLDFQVLYEQIAKPFEWKFTRLDLQELMNKLKQKEQPVALAA